MERKGNNARKEVQHWARKEVHYSKEESATAQEGKCSRYEKGGATFTRKKEQQCTEGSATKLKKEAQHRQKRRCNTARKRNKYEKVWATFPRKKVQQCKRGSATKFERKCNIREERKCNNARKEVQNIARKEVLQHKGSATKHKRKHT